MNTKYIFFLILASMLIFVILKLQTKDTSHQTRTNSLSTTVSNSVDLVKNSPSKPSPSPVPKPIVYSGFCQNVPILMYHHIQSSQEASQKNQQRLTVDTHIFDNQMSYLLQAGYNSLSVDELVNSLKTKTKVPNKSLVITLDDGYKDAYTNAFPILNKYHLKANLMIPTGLLGNPDYLSWDDLKRMVDTGLAFAYDHTWSHANLSTLSDEKIKTEILTAKVQLEEKLGKTVNIFAYPYGLENQRIINILQTNGFIAALSAIPGTTQCDSFIMSLRRVRIGNAPLKSYGL